MFILKTFDDLNFQPHAHAKDMGVQASMTFDNGYSISVVANLEAIAYGIIPTLTRIAWRFRTSNHDDVLGWQDSANF